MEYLVLLWTGTPAQNRLNGLRAGIRQKDTILHSLWGRRLGPGPYDRSKAPFSLPTLSCSPAAFSVGNSSGEKDNSRLEALEPVRQISVGLREDPSTVSTPLWDQPGNVFPGNLGLWHIYIQITIVPAPHFTSPTLSDTVTNTTTHVLTHHSYTQDLYLNSHIQRSQWTFSASNYFREVQNSDRGRDINSARSLINDTLLSSIWHFYWDSFCSHLTLPGK